jgi:hypothetical protein
MILPPSHQDSPRHSDWLARVIQLESEGLDRSDAQGIADMEAEQTKQIITEALLDIMRNYSNTNKKKSTI